MLIAAIHQPHYLPWLGYLHKMAQADAFIIGDEMQLTDCSPMVRNKFIDQSGKELFLTVDVFKKDNTKKTVQEIMISNQRKWQANHRKFFLFQYKKHPYFNEVWERVEFIYSKEYEHLFELEMDTILIFRELYNIDTPLIMQSNLDYDGEKKKDHLLISMLKEIGADVYLSGNGARKYTDENNYAQEGIKLIFQKFEHPVYSQKNSPGQFVPNLSALDMLFNLGIEGARAVFAETVRPIV